MNRTISFVIALCCTCAISLSAFAGTKVDAFLSLQAPARMDAAAAMKLTHLSSEAPEPTPTSVFVRTADAALTRERITEFGGAVHTAIGEILTATVDLTTVEALAAGDEVISIEGAKPIQMRNDIAGEEIAAAEVHEGVQLPDSFSGAGVIVGLVDTGIDYHHPDFQDDEGRSRILAIWDQNRPGGPYPRELDSSYGTECDAESVADGSCPLFDADGHGTHVAGTMAGRHESYGGIAPDANIVVVSYDSSLDMGSGYANTIFSTNICQAAYYVFEKARAAGMPAVVNLSLGTHIGAHDGTSLFESCLAGLVEGSAGRAIVAAAGNEYSNDARYTGIHAGGSVDGVAATNFVIRRTSRDRIYYIDLWADAGSDLAVGLAIHEGTPDGDPLEFSGMAEAGTTRQGTFLDGDVEYLINMTETESTLNGKQHVGVRIRLGADVTTPSQFSFDLVVEGTGNFDAWLFPDKPAKMVQFTNVEGDRGAGWNYLPGDRQKSVAIPATSPAIVAVGGYTTRNDWDGGPGCCRISYTLGDILNFSSAGPSADPERTGQKPEIAAPGGMIVSALSHDANPNSLLLMDEEHVLQAGTSMAAPFVSGTIALMFSANPNFTHTDVKGYIIAGAYADDFTGDVPNDRWGYGKLDVLTSVGLAIDGGASGSFSVEESLAQPEGPGSKSSCQLVVGGLRDRTALLPPAIVLFATMLIASMRRRRTPALQR